MIVLTFYGLPLNIIRDVYITARSFITRLRDLMRYRTATRNMDERYPNATEEELASMNDKTCIICREEMVSQTPAQAPNSDGNTDTSASAPREGQTENPTPTAHADGPNMTPKRLPCGHFFPLLLFAVLA